MTASACFSVSRENLKAQRLREVDCASGLREYLHGAHLHPMNGRQSLEGWLTVWPTGSASVRCMLLVGSIEIPDSVGVDDVPSLCHVLGRGNPHLELGAAVVTGVAA